jgi:hypothetical protein
MFPSINGRYSVKNHMDRGIEGVVGFLIKKAAMFRDFGGPMK